MPNDAAIEALTANASEAFTLSVTDSIATVTQAFSVNLTGTNDTPALSASLTSTAYTDTAADDTFSPVTGTLSATDRDSGQTLTYDTTGSVADASLAGYDRSRTGTYGTLYVNSTSGAYTFVPNDAAIEALTANASEAFTLSVTDSIATVTQAFSVNLTGTNDTPALSASLTSTAYTDTAADDTFSPVTGTLSATDRDSGQTLTYDTTGSVADASLAGYDRSRTGTYGTLYVNSTSGAYTFVPNDAAIEALTANASEAFTLSVTDSIATVTQAFSVNLTGTNDTPALSASLTSTAYTDTAADDTFSPVTGTLSATDRDSGQTLTYDTTGSVADASLAGYDRSRTGTYGTLYVNSTSGAYTFVPNDAAIEALTANASEAFTLSVTDSIATVTQAFSVNLTGTNDTPALSASLTSTAYTDTAADDTFSPVTGTLSATDRDSGQTLTYDTTGSVADASLAGYDRSRTGTYGTLYVNSTSGAYTFVPNDAAIEALTANASEAFTLSVTDSIATVTQAFSVNLTGTNDTPALSASLTSTAYTDTAADDTFSPVTGTLSATDRDSGQTLTYDTTGSVADASLAGYDRSRTGTYGTLYVNSTSGAYTFVPNDAAIEALTANASEAFTLSVTDSIATVTQAFSVNLTGTNDTPALSASLTSTAYTDTAADDTFSPVTGTLSATDRDSGQTLTYDTTGSVADASLAGYDRSRTGTYGTLYVNSTSGAYTFVPNDAAIEALTANASEAFTLSVTDSIATVTQAFSVNLTGTNDTPIVTVSAVILNYIENDPATVVDGSLTVTDVDSVNLAGATARISAGTYQPGQDILGYDSALLPGGVTANWSAATGTLSFSGSASVLQYEALLRSVTYQNTSDNPSATVRSVLFVASGGAGSSTPGLRGISVAPVNDAPALTVNRLTLTDGQTVTLKLADLNAIDIDNPPGDLSFTVSGVQYGRFQLANAPGAAITTFTYNQLVAGSVQFVHAGGNQVPAYVVTPSDLGLAGATTSAQILFTPAGDPSDGGALLQPRNSVVDDPLTVLAPPETRSFDANPLGLLVVDAPIPVPRGFETFDVIEAPAEPAPVAASRTPYATSGFAKTDPNVETESMAVLRLPGPVIHAELANLDFEGPQRRSNIDVLLDMVKMSGLALSVGAVWWATRAAGLIASALSSLPAWRNFDPLPVLGRDEFEEDDWVQDHDKNATAESEEEERLVERRFSNDETQPINVEELRKAIAQK